MTLAITSPGRSIFLFLFFLFHCPGKKSRSIKIEATKLRQRWISNLAFSPYPRAIGRFVTSNKRIRHLCLSVFTQNNILIKILSGAILTVIFFSVTLFTPDELYKIFPCLAPSCCFFYVFISHIFNFKKNYLAGERNALKAVANHLDSQKQN